MTPVRFTKIGELLYGPSWRGALALALDVAPRTISRWADETSPIPSGISIDMAKLCDEKAKQLANIACGLRSSHKTEGGYR